MMPSKILMKMFAKNQRRKVMVVLCVYYLLLLLIFCHVTTLFHSNVILDLGGADVWQFYSPSNASVGRLMTSKNVPGDIYSDLEGVYGISPLFGDNDQQWRWIGHQKWVYQRTFYLPHKILQEYAVILHVKGLDTIAQVYINENLLLVSVNQFISYAVDVANYLTENGTNTLRIVFESPIDFAFSADRAYEVVYSHGIPPDCPNNIQNGECHINFLRKIQSSFSWDWGPAFTTIGIWQPIYLELFPSLTILEYSPVVTYNRGTFEVTVFLRIFCTNKKYFVSMNSLHIRLSIEELNISKLITVRQVQCPSKSSFNATLHIPQKANISLWFPRGYGQQKLYNLTIAAFFKEQFSSCKSKKIGFRTIELVQDLIDTTEIEKGRTFYFKINGISVFLKGSNWIPISMFPARNHTQRLQFLFLSMIEANFNALRVWGGGMYESDAFYELADQHGILIWQDLMFACALYPTNEEFLTNIQNEIEQQVYRLRSHVSIILYASNNENELSIARDWNFEASYNRENMIHDYLILYRDTIKVLVQSIDQSRPFLFSSPSNGVQTDAKAIKSTNIKIANDEIMKENRLTCYFSKENNISFNPNDPAYGDIHHYNEYKNLWDDESYEIPRCATEFGVQSLPAKATMLKWIPENEWWYGSKSLMLRQHHPGGVLTLLYFISQHFDVPKGASVLMKKKSITTNQSIVMDEITFLSQIHQAVALQTQTEHYRRWRSKVNEQGLGRTMCAMYWQLNDVWAAPTWSSIDFELHWKPAHYFARRFFASTIISLQANACKMTIGHIYLKSLSNEGNDLNVFAISDELSILKDVHIRLEVFLVGIGSFEPLYTDNRTVDIQPLSAQQIDFNPCVKKILTAASKQLHLPRVSTNNLLFRAHADFAINDRKKKTQIFSATLLPNLLTKCPPDVEDLCVQGTVSITNLNIISNFEYILELSGIDGISPVVWIELNFTYDYAKYNGNDAKKKTGNDEEKNKILHYFSDNAFAMTERRRLITFYVVDRFILNLPKFTMDDFIIRTLYAK